MFPLLTNFNSDKYLPLNFCVYTYLAILAEQVKLAEESVKKTLKKSCFYVVFIGTKIAYQLLIVLDS